MSNQPSSSYSRILKPTPTKKQAIILPTQDDVNLIEYVIAIGQIVTPQCIISASKISNKRACIYLDSEVTLNNLMKTNNSILVQNVNVPIRRLVAPARRIILSNVHTCLPNSIILDALKELKIKPVSAIHDLHIRTSSQTLPEKEMLKYKHITTFRRAIYIEDESVSLPSYITVSFEQETFRIFINESEQRCHLCNSTSHIAANCDCPNLNKFTSNTPFNDSESLEELTFEERLKQAREKALLHSSQIINQNRENEATSTQQAVPHNKPENGNISTQSESSPTIPQIIDSDSELMNTDAALSNKRALTISSLDSNAFTSQPENATNPKQDSSPRKKVKVSPLPENLKQSNAPSAQTQDNGSTENLGTQESSEIEQILQPAKELFDDPSKSQPISFDDLVDLFIQTKKPKEIPHFIAEYINNSVGLIKLLDQTYQKIKNKNIRNHISRMKKAISKANAESTNDK